MAHLLETKIPGLPPSGETRIKIQHSLTTPHHGSITFILKDCFSITAERKYIKNKWKNDNGHFFFKKAILSTFFFCQQQIGWKIEARQETKKAF